MKYIDMHCDTLTVCFDKKHSLADCPLQTSLEKLNNGQCAAQCFAIFTQGDCAAASFKNYLSFYLDSLKQLKIAPVLNCGELLNCISGDGTGAILTVENLGFLTDLNGISALYDSGVRMASLVWNYENVFAYPNLIFENAMPCFDKREKRGLKEAGKRALELLDKNKIIVDISHLSDGGADEILSGRKIPVVASHSNAAEVYNVCRNLTDGQIKKIADCGGAIGINFCKDFLGTGDTFDCVLKQIKHIINVGGEDVVAFGSDFDGIPVVPRLEDCTEMQTLLYFLSVNGLSQNQLEKLCYKNFVRIFAEVCG